MARKAAPQTSQPRDSLPRRYNSYVPKADLRESRPDGPAVEPAPKRHILLRIAIWTLLVLLVLGLLVGVWDARNISAATTKLFGSGNLLSLVSASSLRTDSSGRVDVLVAGYSIDDPGHNGAALTDSIMLLSMNPSDNTGYMLSIPRDLYVEIPGYGHAKINEAYKDGGMDLLVQAVNNIFDTQVGYYALVDYTAVRSIVDAVGGIDVTINSPDGRLYDPNKDWSTGGVLVDLTNGSHHLEGEQALDLTRARGDPSPYGDPVGFGQSDFQRTADQRLVFAAIKSKMNWHLILNPRQNGKILNAIADNVKTNIGIDEARPLFSLFNRIPSDKLQSASLRDLNGRNYLIGSDYEGDTLTPAAGLNDYSQINDAISQLNR